MDCIAIMRLKWSIPQKYGTEFQHAANAFTISQPNITKPFPTTFIHCLNENHNPNHLKF